MHQRKGAALTWASERRAVHPQDLSSLPDIVIQRVKLRVANQLPKLCTSKMKQMGCISFLPLLNEDEAHIDENSPWQIALRSTGSKEHKD